MVRRIIRVILTLTLRIFFRRVEVAGLERVPAAGPVIFVLNHPNGLVDPVFILCLAPRRVSFLAKSPLFRMPVVGYFVRALDSIPVYRRQDEGEDTTRNRETFARCRDLLARGGTIAICPEGVSHDEPQLRPLKTGTARIALGAAAVKGGGETELKIVPAGLYYTAKTTFRSSALLYFGEPITVEPVPLGPDGEPPREAVTALSERIAAALKSVILDAEHEQALSIVARAERIFSSAAPPEDLSLERELRLRRRFIANYSYLRAREPARLAGLEARINQYEAELAQLGLDPDDLSTPSSSSLAVARFLLTRTILFILLAPFALAGLCVHYPAYRLAGFFAVKLAKGSGDVISTFKIMAAMLLFPLTWIIVALILYEAVGWPSALLALLLAPISGYAAVRFFEEFDRFLGGARALAFFFTRRRFFLRLLAERRAIRNEILALGGEALRSPL